MTDYHDRLPDKTGAMVTDADERTEQLIFNWLCRRKKISGFHLPKYDPIDFQMTSLDGTETIGFLEIRKRDMMPFAHKDGTMMIGYKKFHTIRNIERAWLVPTMFVFAFNDGSWWWIDPAKVKDYTVGKARRGEMAYKRSTDNEMCVYISKDEFTEIDKIGG